MNARLERLLRDLRDLRAELRTETLERYRRVNPFYEDLTDWKERGQFWRGEDRGITIYESTTLIGDVEIGDNTWIGPFCSIDGSGGLSIGDHCSISTGCQIVTHDTVSWALSAGRQPYQHAPIKIGRCCFLGSHAVVTKGITIGDHCLIGAGAVVTRDIPSFSIAAGVPARVIGQVAISDDGAVRLIYDEPKET